MSCVFCNIACEIGIELSDGNIIHNSCYDNNVKRLEYLKETIKKKRTEAELAQKEYYDENDFVSDIFRFFSGKQKKYTHDPWPEMKRNIDLMENEIKALEEKVTYVHDFMLQYPPDWKERRERLRECDEYKCVYCGDRCRLQMHHITPLSKGGSNKLNNLEFVCVSCHAKLHNKEEDSFLDRRYGKLQIQKNIDFLTQAINMGDTVQFYYKKKTDQVHIKRIFKPEKFTKAYHVKNPQEFTLCIEGFCYLRNDTRIFAVKKIRNLEKYIK